MWHLNLFGVDNQTRFLRSVDVDGEKFSAANEVLAGQTGVKSNDNVGTVPREVWDQVRQSLSDRQTTHRAFAQAMNTKFCGSTMWKHSPSRRRIHRAAATIDDQELHDLATGDLFWDRTLEITSNGEQDVYDATVSDAHSLVAHGIIVCTGTQPIPAA